MNVQCFLQACLDEQKFQRYEKLHSYFWLILTEIFLNLLVVHNVIWKSSISNQEQKRQCLYHHEENKRRAVWFLKLWVEGCVAESKGPDSRYINIKMFRDSFLCSDTTPPPPNLRWNIVAIWVSSCLKIEHSFQLLNCSWYFTDQEERWKWSCLKKNAIYLNWSREKINMVMSNKLHCATYQVY